MKIKLSRTRPLTALACPFARNNLKTFIGVIVLGIIIAISVVALGVVDGTGIVRRSQGSTGRQGDRANAETSYTATAVKGAETKQTPVPSTADVDQQPSNKTQKPAPKPTKYSTSSNPRSTAYSTTLPAPNPASFLIKITHAGQLAAGDLVYYNATKGEKGYYNGDLILNPSTVTISRSGTSWAPITVSSPSSKNISMPTEPWDDRNPYFSIATQGSVPAPALSDDLIVDTFNMPANGTYLLHITANCGDASTDGCQSDGFITVNVAD